MSSNLLSMTSDEIVAIPEDQPEKLFTFTDYEKEFRKLVRRWHPDANTHPRADEVTAHLNKLLEAAKRKVKEKTWPGHAELILTDIDSSKVYRLKFTVARPIEVGWMYIGRHFLVFVLDENNRDLYDNALARIQGLSYRDSEFETEFKRYFPDIEKSFVSDRGPVLVLRKPENAVLLDDLITYAGGQIDPRHVGWIVNSLYNISMFLAMQGLVHNDLSPHAYFVDPKTHFGLLLGGWWYAMPKDGRLKALPAATLDCVPETLLENKTARLQVDQYVLKQTGLQCLGDAAGTGSVLLGNASVPAPLLDHLRRPPVDRTLDDFKDWPESHRFPGHAIWVNP